MCVDIRNRKYYIQILSIMSLPPRLRYTNLPEMDYASLCILHLLDHSFLLSYDLSVCSCIRLLESNRKPCALYQRDQLCTRLRNQQHCVRYINNLLAPSNGLSLATYSGSKDTVEWDLFAWWFVSLNVPSTVLWRITYIMGLQCLCRINAPYLLRRAR